MKYLIGLITDKSPRHKHNDYEIIIYTKGSGIFHSDDKDIPVSAGQFIIVPPEAVHSSTFEGEFNRLFIKGNFNQIFNLSVPTLVADDADGEGMQLAKMIYKNRYSNPEYSVALINAFAHFLLQSLKMDDELSLVIEDIIDKITNNFYDSNLKLSELLNKSGYAEDYIRARFKKITGKTPVDFLTNIRISHACYLIDTYKTALSLTEIAEKCGYTDYVYFSRRFKHIMGVSPRAYMLA